MRYLSLFSGMEAAHIAWAPLGWECAGVAEVEAAPCALLSRRLGATAPRYLPESPEKQPKLFDRRKYFDGGTLPNLGDVSQVTDEDIRGLGPIDVVIGGSPCQDLSVAGRRAGLAGERSGLFHDQMRIFHAARTFCGARWLVWENVPGAFSSNAGRDFAVVVGEMAGCELPVPVDGWGTEGLALGANGLAEWAVLDAQWFGVAQRRRRVFVVLDTGDWTDRPPVLLVPDSVRGDHPPRRESGEGVAGTLSGHPTGGGGLGAGVEGGLLGVSPAVTSKWAKGTGGPAGDECQNLVPVVDHTLRGEGFDASEDGTGRGTPLVPVAFNWQGGGTQTSLGYDPEAGITGALHVGQTPAVAVGVDCYNGDMTGNVAATMGTRGSSQTATGPQVMAGMAVRRLTPRECERLQGAPDDWTLVLDCRGKPLSDGPRYKMIGNSFAAPVIKWIGQRIEVAERGWE